MLDLAVAAPWTLSVVARREGQYLGQPTTVLFQDGKTLLTAYPDGHGQGKLLLSRSHNGGNTWCPVEVDVATVPEVPTLYKLPLPGGRERVLLVTCQVAKGILEWMWSDDQGNSWSPRKQWRLEGTRGAIVALASLWPLAQRDRFRGIFHDFNFDNFTVELELVADPTAPGGFDCRFSQLTPIPFASEGGRLRARAAGLCEAGAVVSPDGASMALLFRPQNKKTNAMISFSRDRGSTWSDPVELPGSLTGERHTARYAPDGRLVICFRDYSPLNPTNPSHGDWVAWVGTWDDLVQSREGYCRIRLHRNFGNSTNANIGDCGYTGLEVLPNGCIVAISYGHWEVQPGSKHPNHPGGRGKPPYLLQARFTLTEIDQWLQVDKNLLMPLSERRSLS
ncbi:sialidase family protein [Armatimonas rosea]|uniref:Exo-alpha-sialidase n=1 Tax=Armatimonas rosea TaxID=685828 RepID=A0A7W9SQU7_ARMRO|nr:sialidase family protein [Armatimonas rosea]MBB6050770.1 hypothetical protein [Armatimonas rosea]